MLGKILNIVHIVSVQKVIDIIVIIVILSVSIMPKGPNLPAMCWVLLSSLVAMSHLWLFKFKFKLN